MKVLFQSPSTLLIVSGTLLMVPPARGRGPTLDPPRQTAEAWTRAWISIDAERLLDPFAHGVSAGRLRLPGVGLPTGDQALSAPSVTPQSYFKASNTDPMDAFGWSVAMSGDTLVVGAPFEASGTTGVPSNNGAPGAGAAYVFVRQGTDWVPQAYLKASNPDPDDFFGGEVAIAGDTLVVGAPGESSASTGVNGAQANNAAPEAGAAYVFHRSGATWTQQAYLKASSTGAGDYFGRWLALSGDTLAVGAPFEDSSGSGVNSGQTDDGKTDSGAVYVFTRSGVTWTQEAFVKATRSDADDYFGAVALEGDWLAVGAPLEDSASPGVNGDASDDSLADAGAAYTFVRDANGWHPEAYLKAASPGAGDLFGTSLSLSGQTLLIGAIGAGSGGAAPAGVPLSGAAYAFVHDGTTWTQQARLVASNPGTQDLFGLSVHVSDDTALVGAPFEASNSSGVGGDQNDLAPQSGAVYVFDRSGSTWGVPAFVKATNSDPGDAFGWSVEGFGDRMAVGARGEDSQATDVDGDQNDNSAELAGAAHTYVVQPPPCDVFCPSLPNATGSVAELSCSGSPTSSLVLTSTPVPNTPGQFFFGPTMLAGNPFGDGLLCVGGAVTRIPGFVQAGMMMQPANTAVIAIDYAAPYAAGLTGTRYFQHWFRSGVATGSGFNTSSGLSVTF